MSSFRDYKGKLRWRGSMRKEGTAAPRCPHCGGDLIQKSAGYAPDSHTYWQCRICGMNCSNMDAVAGSTYDEGHPDPWMDNEPGGTTFPEHWAGVVPDPASQRGIEMFDDDYDDPYQSAESWRSADPHVPADYRIDPEFGCLTHAENLVAQVPHLRYQEGWARGSNGQWGAHAWAESPGGEVVDPYFEWKLPGEQLEYRRAEPHEDPFDRDGHNSAP